MLTVDVRDMVCAQALEQVALAVKKLGIGQPLDVVYNATDVREDLEMWAADRRHHSLRVADEILRITRRT